MLCVRLHPACVGLAVGAGQARDALRKREQRAALAAGDGGAAHLNGVPAGLADHLLSARHGNQFRAALAAGMLLGVQLLGCVILGIQPIQRQQPGVLLGREMRQPGLAEGGVLHVQRHIDGRVIGVQLVDAFFEDQLIGQFHLLFEQLGERPEPAGRAPGAAGQRDALQAGFQCLHPQVVRLLARVKILDHRARREIIHQPAAEIRVVAGARRDRLRAGLHPLPVNLLVERSDGLFVTRRFGLCHISLHGGEQAVVDGVGEPGVGAGIGQAEVIIHQRAAEVAVEVGGGGGQQFGRAALAAVDAHHECRERLERIRQRVAHLRQIGRERILSRCAFFEQAHQRLLSVFSSL